jgi:phosphatidylethanolamine/phosphatidyl-N-methylethanolamine N-methyltransferase
MKKIDVKNVFKEEVYREYLYTGLLGFLFRYQHKLLTPDYLLDKRKILEIGPSFEPHIKFKKLNYKEYHCLEINESPELIEYYKKHFKDVHFNSYDGSKLNYPDNTFDRIIISHTLEHILDPENFINEMLRVLKPECCISVALPCDNGFFWRLGRFILKKTYHKRKGTLDIDYDYMMAKEHVNTIFQLLSIFKKKYIVKEQRFIPFFIPSPDLNLIYICHIFKKNS